MVHVATPSKLITAKQTVNPYRPFLWLVCKPMWAESQGKKHNFRLLSFYAPLC